MEQEKPRPGPAPEPVIRDDVRVEGAPVRCPFCHEDVDVDGAWSACGRCLARHHDGCWQEGARCSACGHDVAVRHAARTAAPATPRPRRGQGLAIAALAAVAAMGVAMLVSIGAYASLRKAPPRPAPAVAQEALARPAASRGERRGALEVHDGRGNFALVFEAEGTLLFGLGVELRELGTDQVAIYHGGGQTTFHGRGAAARAAKEAGRTVTIVTRRIHRDFLCRVPEANVIEGLRSFPLDRLDLVELARRAEHGELDDEPRAPGR